MSKKIVTVLAAIAVIGVGTLAFAHWTDGYGVHGWMHGGYGMHNGYYGDPGYGYRSDLNDEQVKSLEKEQAAFWNETEKIRQDLYVKDLALQSELAKNDPDAKRAAALQKEISELEAQLNQKRIDHMIQVRKISPDIDWGFAGMGPMMGYGNPYPGSCWQ